MAVQINKINKGGGETRPSFQRIVENEGAIEKWIEKTKKLVQVEPKPGPERGKTMRVRMIRTRPGGVDGGIRVEIFHEGKVYDMEEPLALAFLRCGHAVEDKMFEAAPEVKEKKAEPDPADGGMAYRDPVVKPQKPIKRGRK